MKSEKIFLIMCNKCHNKMQIATGKANPLKSTKQCFYCGKRFIVNKDNLLGRVK